MKNAKVILSLVLAAAMLLSFAACGGKSNNANTTPANNTTPAPAQKTDAELAKEVDELIAAIQVQERNDKTD